MKPDVLVHRCSHKGFSQLITLLTATAEGFNVRLDFLTRFREAGKFLTWAEIASYKAVVFFPHVPNPMSFSELYAMSMPLFLPAEPEIWSWIWTHSDPFAGPGFPLKQLQSPIDLRDIGPE
eukprot:2943456-Amphidinium_carterae.1